MKHKALTSEEGGGNRNCHDKRSQSDTTAQNLHSHLGSSQSAQDSKAYAANVTAVEPAASSLGIAGTTQLVLYNALLGRGAYRVIPRDALFKSPVTAAMFRQWHDVRHAFVHVYRTNVWFVLYDNEGKRRGMAAPLTTAFVTYASPCSIFGHYHHASTGIWHIAWAAVWTQDFSEARWHI